MTFRLIAMSGRAQAVSVDITLQPLSLSADLRRALVLIGSELIINALRHGVSFDRSGKIAVRLAAVPGLVRFIVADDGPGVVENYVPYEGGKLLDQLAAILGATISRAAGINGRGYEVTIAFAADVGMDQKFHRGSAVL